MSEVDYVPFATGAGANVYAAATYQALAVVGTGVEPGLADPQLANTTWRLASMISAAVGNFISNTLGINILDDGNLTNLITNLTSAISAGSAVNPSRTVTSSSALNILVTDYAIAVNRTTSLAPLAAALPPGAAIGQKFKVAPVDDNSQNYPITVSPPAGHSIAGLSEIVMNVNRKAAEYQYHGSSVWSVTGWF